MTLKDARDLAGVTQTRLEDLGGLTRGAVHDLESGRNERPSHETVTRVIHGLRRAGLRGVTAEQIFPVPGLDVAETDSASA